jgi:hypothetical protein
MRPSEFQLPGRVFVRLERGFIVLSMLRILICGVVFICLLGEWILFDKPMEAGYLGPDIGW